MFFWNKLSKRFVEAAVYKLFCAQKVLDVEPLAERVFTKYRKRYI